ncbi:tandem-95 repeat protein, partial [Pseudoalteromonas sp. MMG012]|uniref:tandem-95 repeat protein n=1 Tax=Pseudoalteromonas sp. MMG012 TaxID=2822686 RepID=UPI001B39F68F
EDNLDDNSLFKVEYGHIRLDTPPETTLGEYKISVTLENHNEPSLNVTKQFTIEVVDHVTLSGRPKSNAYQNQTYSFSPTISHSDHLNPNEYSFHIENKPTWATFDTRLGMLEGTPTEDDLGTTDDIHIYVTDGKARYLIEPFSITVLPFNYSQKVHYIAPHNLYTGRAFSLFPNYIENTDNDPLTYQLIKAPQWMKINPISGELFGIPEVHSDTDLLESTVLEVTIAVSDGENTYQSSVTLHITKLDDAELILPLTGDLSYSSGMYGFNVNEDHGLLSHFNISNELKNRLSVSVINIAPLCQNHGLYVSSNGAFTLNNNYSNTPTCQFQFIVQDFNQASKVHTANLTFSPDLVSPTINWDRVFIEEDQKTTIDVLANDVIGDKSSAKSTLKITSAPKLGDAEVIDGQIKYTPRPNMFGQDTLSYSFDSPYHGVIGQVTIDINFSNDVPTVMPHTTQLIEDGVSQSISLRTLTSDIEDGVPAGAINIISSPTKGAMSFNLQDESIVYTPRANETGSDALSFTVTDNFGAVSEPGIITFDIEAVNDTPTAQNDTLNTLEDTIKELNILENDSDIEDDTFTADNITLEDQGQGAGIYPLANVTVTPTGNLSVNPTINANGAFAFTYTVTDSGGITSQPATVNVLIKAVNDVPSADSKKLEAIEEQPIAITLTASDVEQSPLTYKIISMPKSGNLTIINDVVTYTGNLNFSGADSFTYAAFDQTSWSTPATVNVNVANVQDLPLISGSPATNVKQGQLYDFTPTASDVDNDALSFTINNMPSWLSFNASTGQLVGTPSNNDVNQYTNIAIKVFDGTGYTGLTPFSIEVINVNDAPTLTGTPAASVNEDALYSFTPSLTDVDLDDSHTFYIENAPMWATFNTTSGVLSGTPTNKHVGSTDNVIISVTDKAGEKATLPAFNITVKNVNDAPQLTGTPSSSVAQDSTYTFTPTLSDIDVDDSHTFAIQNRPEWVTFNTESGTLTGTPLNKHVGGTENITISVTDKAGEKATLPAFDITVENINDAPQLTGVPSSNVAQDSVYTFTPTLIDVDKSDSHTFAILNKPEWTSFNSESGTLTGTPLNKHVGSTDNVIISVTDKAGEKATLPTFSITVSNTNDAPQLTGTPPSSVAQDSAYTFTPTLSDIDVDDSHTFAIQNKPEWATFNTESGTLSGTPLNEHVNYNTNIIISVTDKAGATATLPTFSIEVINANDAATLTGTPRTEVTEGNMYHFLPTLTDPDVGDDHTFSIINKPEWADFDTSNGALTGTPLDQHVGLTENIIINVKDNVADSLSVSLAPFSITVINSPDIPSAEPFQFTLNEGEALSIGKVNGLLSTATDVDLDSGDTLIAILRDTVKYGTLTLNESGAFTYEHDGSETLEDTFTYFVKDSTYLPSTVETVTLTINPVDDAPIAKNDEASTQEDTPVTFSLIDNDTDAEQKLVAASAMLVTEPKFGSVSITNGIATYTPNEHANGPDSFTYTVSDSTPLTSEPATVNIAVAAVNDAPKATNIAKTTDEDTNLVILVDDIRSQASDIEDTNPTGD